MPRRRYRGSPIPEEDEATAAVEKRECDARTPESEDGLFGMTYSELRRMAARIRRADPNATISTGTLVHETWIKLARSRTLTPSSELHLKRIVAKAMRRYVVEAARRRRSLKRGGHGFFVTWDDSLDLPVSGDREVVALDDALLELARVNPRQAALVELCFFGGTSFAEAAQILGVAERTAERDWRAARAWLAAQIRGEQ